MSTIVTTITVTWTGPFTASTIPNPNGAARTLATGDRAITEIAESVRQKIATLMTAVDPGANQHTTVASTIA